MDPDQERNDEDERSGELGDEPPFEIPPGMTEAEFEQFNDRMQRQIFTELYGHEPGEEPQPEAGG